MNQILDAILGGLGFIYGERWVVPFVLLPIMLFGAAWIHLCAVVAARPYLRAAKLRIAALRFALGPDSDPVAERASFSHHYLDTATVMNKEDSGAHSLVQAWREFQETMIDESVSPIRNTNRPSAFFHRAAPRQTLLIFWSNIFVGVGLILTFLGLIVALNTAAKGMAGGDVGHAQIALTGLLTVAGAKFFTSVGGLLASIWLRFAEHGLSGRVRRATDSICGLLERGLLYVPLQRIAVEQLEVLKEQRDQLKFFNTDVALQLTERIGAQFQQAIAPVAASLVQLNDNMASVTEGIGAGAREAIEKVSGDQLRGLSEALATLGQRLETISGSVGSSGDEAARQIRVAGSDFAQAAADIRTAFDTLATRVDGMGGRLAEQSEAALGAQRDALAQVISGLQDAQSRSAETILDAVRSLKDAGAQAAETMQREVGAALTTGVAESQRTFKAALEESGGPLRETATELSRAFSDATEKVERAGAGFARSGDAAIRTAESLVDVTGHARSISVSLNDASKGFATAAQPFATAAQAIDGAAGRIERVMEADAAALRSIKDLSDGVRKTQEAAETAWRNYRERFEGVDKALAQITEKLASTLGESLGEFRKFATDFDAEMAKAVSKLGTTVDGISEYADALDDYVENARVSQEAAE